MRATVLVPLHQPAQHGPGLLRADQKLVAGKGIEGGRFLLRLLDQLVGIDGDLAGVDAGGRRDRGGHDVRLGHEGFHPGVDEALARLVEVENPPRQDDQARQIDEDDAGQK